jgi:hypothetical protein
MQTKEQIEDWYKIPDRWQYFQSADDDIRRHIFLNMLPETYTNALDIGAGECFITQKLPAQNIYGIEWSDNAASRFPPNVTRIHQPSCDTNYDLVVTTGTLYPQYDHKQIYGWILEAASYHILVAGIKDWLMDYPFERFCKVIDRKEFPYLNFTQQVTLYQINK